MQTGLWYSAKEEYIGDTQIYNLIDNDFAVKKQYYAYSLMTSQIPRNSAIYPLIINSEFCAGTKFAIDSGDVYTFANSDYSSYKFAFQAEENTKWNVYMYEQNSLPEDDSLLPVLKQITAKDLCVTFEVPANTVVLVKQAS
jgi:alpha-galactosidase